MRVMIIPYEDGSVSCIDVSSEEQEKAALAMLVRAAWKEKCIYRQSKDIVKSLLEDGTIEELRELLTDSDIPNIPVLEVEEATISRFRQWINNDSQ